MITLTEPQKRFIARNKLRFFTGFGMISVFMGIVGFGMSLVTMITVKGIYIPAWVIAVIGIMLIVSCWYSGYWYEMIAMWKYEISHTNNVLNPEMLKLCTEVSEIKKLLQERK
jgi:hypothetical protein